MAAMTVSGSKPKLAGGRLRETIARLAAALMALPALGAALLAFLTQNMHDAADGLPLLAALGGLALTGCVGQLMSSRVSFDGAAILRAFRSLAAPLSGSFAPDDEGIAGAGEHAAPLVPATSSYFSLYAGLGGWVNSVDLPDEGSCSLAGRRALR